MTIFTECSDTTEDSTQERKLTPYDVLERCKAILAERGQLRDKGDNILESSFAAAAEIYNRFFATPEDTITTHTVIEMLIALKLARIAAARDNGKEDQDGILDLINYLAFLYAENRNNP